jgi:ubiquinone/menaquinone biosynthesis C-methylase UbiE
MLLLRTPKLGQRGTVLDVLCGTGSVTAALIRRPGKEGLRVVAIDWAPGLLDVARRKIGDAAGRRVFFRSEMDEGRLPFDSDVYDLVVSNLGLLEVPEPRRLLSEMARVAKPGAAVLCTLPMRGSFTEVEALLEEVLREAQLSDAVGRLREHRSWLPSATEARSWLAEAGLTEVRVDCEPYSLLFGGGQELLGAAVVEYGPLPLWREVIGGPGKAPGRDELIEGILERLRQRVDERTRQGAGFAPFEVTVRAGCLVGRKPLTPPPSGPPGPPGGEEVELHTGEIDIMTLGRMSQK